MLTFKNMVGEKAISFNKYITSDAEEAMFETVRGMIHNVPCFNKSHHRLDKFHLLTKYWKYNVTNKIAGDPPQKSWYIAFYVGRYV